MKDRRVLMTTDVIGGVWDFCMTFARGACRLGDSITLLALGSPSSDQRCTAEQLGARLISAPLKLEWMDGAGTDVPRTRQLVADVAREIRADVVHANQFAAVCADVHVPTVLTVHSDVLSWRRWTLESSEIPPRWESYAALVRDALTKADAVATVSQFLADEVRSLYRTERPLEVIHNGWPVPASTPHNTRGTLVAGRIWDQAKNVGLIAQAATGWDRGDVYLAGDQNHPDGGVAHAPWPLRPLGVLDRATMDAWLAQVAVYISPARYDPFGLLPLQAALYGCALILSDIPSYRELWSGAACFFKSGDANDLRRKWQALLSDPASLKHLQEDAFRRAQSRFSAAQMIETYRTLYARVDTRIVA